MVLLPPAQKGIGVLRANERPHASAESCAERGRRDRAELPRAARQLDGLVYLVLEQPFRARLRTVDDAAEAREVVGR